MNWSNCKKALYNESWIIYLMQKNGLVQICLTILVWQMLTPITGKHYKEMKSDQMISEFFVSFDKKSSSVRKGPDTNMRIQLLLFSQF